MVLISVVILGQTQTQTCTSTARTLAHKHPVYIRSKNPGTLALFSHENQGETKEKKCGNCQFPKIGTRLFVSHPLPCVGKEHGLRSKEKKLS